MKWLTAGILMVVMFLTPPLQSAEPETAKAFAKRTAWWQQAKLGLFIHWGLYAVPADCTTKDGKKGSADWHFVNQQMQVKDYEKFAADFNPTDFNAKEWVEIAKNAGAKYIVITAKGYDGFCLFDSKLSDFTITKATPFKRDPIKELAAACKKEGLKLGLEYSIMDWHHPDYLPRRPWEKDVRDGKDANFDRYIDYVKGQLEELLTNYGEIGVLWFNGVWEHDAKEYRAEEVAALVRKLQPNILINDRFGIPGDFNTPELTVLGTSTTSKRLWETSMAMTDSWGYAKNDTSWKPADDLMRTLLEASSLGGNMLLGVGPTGAGKFPSESLDRLDVLGKWQKANGESVCGTTRSPFRRLGFEGRCTVKEKTLYVHVFKWPKEGIQLVGLKSTLRNACFLDGGAKADFQASKNSEGHSVLTIKPPAKADSLVTVVALSFDEQPAVDSAAMLTRPDAEGRVSFKAVEATIHGNTAVYESGGGKDNIGYWSDKNDFVTWSMVLKDKGTYQVEVVYACEEGSAGNEYTMLLGNTAILTGKVAATGSWVVFKTQKLGKVNLPAGKQVLTVRPGKSAQDSLMNLREVRLTPVK